MYVLKGTVRGYDEAAGTAEVEVAGSHGGFLTVPVATHLDSRWVSAGKRCAVLNFDLGNQRDSVLVAVYDELPVLMGAGPKPLEFVPGYWTSVDWFNVAKAGASGVIDLSEDFGLPAGIKAVSVRLSCASATVSASTRLSTSSVLSGAGVSVRTQVKDQFMDSSGIVPCDDDGDIYFSQTHAVTGLYVIVTGYFA